MRRSPPRLAPYRHVSRPGHNLGGACSVFPASIVPARYGRPVNRNFLTAARGAAELEIKEDDWRKASYSLGNGECIEVADSLAGHVAVRDSKNPTGSAVVCSADDWKSFLTKIKIRVS